MRIKKLCGDPVCKARVEMQLLLPGDKDIAPPCDQCAAAAMTATQGGLLLALRSVDCHIVGPL